jgi:hypothetical protein
MVDDQLKAVEAALAKAPRPMPMMNGRAAIHGPFDENARISQDFKNYIYTKCAIPPNAVHREAIDMIFVNLSRILSGKADVRQHWDKISDYAKLAGNSCQTSQSSS